MAKCIYARCKRPIPPDGIFCPYCGRKQVREQKPKKHRTREKGTGSVYKLSGNRKRPYYAVLNGRSAGRMYATRQEAEAALESMLACTRPEVFSYTLEDCFNAWSSVAFRDMSTSSQRGYLTSWSYVPERLRQKLARDVRSDDFQEVVDALQGHAPVRIYRQAPEIPLLPALPMADAAGRAEQELRRLRHRAENGQAPH